MEQKKLSELAVNESFEGFVLIKTFQVKTGQTGKNFVDLTIADAHGEMNAKIWNYNETQFASYGTNMLVKVRGPPVQDADDL